MFGTGKTTVCVPCAMTSCYSSVNSVEGGRNLGYFEVCLFNFVATRDICVSHKKSHLCAGYI